MIWFISEQLRHAVDFDAAALMEIQLALYVFHEAVRTFYQFSLVSLIWNIYE